MQLYDPLDSIGETTIDPKIAAATIALCLRYFLATTLEEFQQVERHVEMLMLLRPSPQEPLMLLYNQLLSAARDQALLISEVANWASKPGVPVQSIEIDPVVWEVLLKVGDGRRRVRVEKGWNMEQDEFEARITEIDL